MSASDFNSSRWEQVEEVWLPRISVRQSSSGKPAAELSNAALPLEARVAVTSAGNPNILSKVVMPVPAWVAEQSQMYTVSFKLYPLNDLAILFLWIYPRKIGMETTDLTTRIFFLRIFVITKNQR